MSAPIRTVDDVLALLGHERVRYLNLADDTGDETRFRVLSGKADACTDLIGIIITRRRAGSDVQGDQPTFEAAIDAMMAQGEQSNG